MGRDHRYMAFGYAVPISILGSLMGLGGAEFRLPVLVGPLGYPAKQAVPLNLLVSLATITAALGIRSQTLTLTPLAPYSVVIGSLIAGAVSAAFVGTGLVARVSNARLEQIILWLLVGLGSSLIVEGFLPTTLAGLVPAGIGWYIAAGVVFGLAIGLVSSLLGVAGGELIIPTLVIGFGLDIKTAGTASLLISLPTVLVGVLRYARRRAFPRPALTATVLPMGVGSVLGALLGGTLIGIVPAAFLKVGLGVILILSAVRIFRHARTPPTPSRPAP